MLNTLARMSRSLLSLQQYQDEVAKEKATQAQKLNAKNDRQNKKDILLHEWREFFGHDLIEPSWRSKRSLAAPEQNEGGSLAASLQPNTGPSPSNSPALEHAPRNTQHDATSPNQLPANPESLPGTHQDSSIKNQNSKIRHMIPIHHPTHRFPNQLNLFSRHHHKLKLPQSKIKNPKSKIRRAFPLYVPNALTALPPSPFVLRPTSANFAASAPSNPKPPDPDLFVFGHNS
jgi:hypothetical protein